MLTRLLPCLVFVALGTFALQAQHPCGTHEQRNPWTDNYVQNRGAFPVNPGVPLHVPVKVHMVANDNANPTFPINTLLDAFCELRNDYDSANIEFYLVGGIDTVLNTHLNSHGWNVQEFLFVGNTTMSLDEPDAIDIYFVVDPAGNCGYYLRETDNIFINYMCFTGHTWAHEVGHLLTLPHPFFGWEGVNYVYNQPTPLYHYTDIWTWQDTTINGQLVYTGINMMQDADSSEVEYVDGRNCHTAADRICDTHPDYLSDRWPCNINGQAGGNYKDPANVEFDIDASNIMSYAYDDCMSEFSDGQIMQMRANIISQRQNLLNRPYPVYHPINNPEPTNRLPIDNSVLPIGTISCSWAPVQGADKYVVQFCIINANGYVTAILEESVTTDTTYTTTRNFNPIPQNLTYRYCWRVRPFNWEFTCAPFSTPYRFNTQNFIDVGHLENLSALEVYPSPLPKGSDLFVNLGAAQAANLTWTLYSVTGQAVATGTHDVVPGDNTLQVPNSGFATGVYFLRLQTATESVAIKILAE